MPASPARILVVEDDPSIRAFMTEGLRMEGYLVETAAHGAAALELLDTKPYDLIVLDIIMPVMDGWQFLEAYFQRPEPHAPVIVCAATSQFHKPALDAGAVSYLDKPFDLDDFLQAVATQLAKGGPNA